MPLIAKKEIGEATELGIWKIEEDADWFRSQLILDEKENALIDSIKHPQRKLHWLSSRVLIRTLMQTNHFIHLESDPMGKPVIHNFPVRLSISHSGDLSALLISTKFEVGIDIEKIDNKIFHIQHKFVRDEEYANLNDKKNPAELYVLWCAKESMYKLYSQKQLNFKNHLHVLPFEFKDAGKLVGIISKGTYHSELEIGYEQLDDYMIAYVFD